MLSVYSREQRKDMAGAVSVAMPKGGFSFDLCKR